MQQHEHEPSALMKVAEFISALVRPTLAWMFGGGVLWGFVVGKIDGAAFIGIAGAAIGWYVSTKTHEAANKEAHNTTVVVPDRRQNDARS